MKEAVRKKISFLTQTQSLEHDDAYSVVNAYSVVSIGIDFDVSRVVDINSDTHTRIHKHLFANTRAC
jgi:acetamidase/formamidase